MLVGDQGHVLSQLTQQRTRLLMLLFKQQLQLLIGYETHVNKNLAYASRAHKFIPLVNFV